MGLRALVADDTPASLDLMVYLLEAHGHLVTRARNGQEVLVLAHECRPDVIVCDVQMPGIDGFEAARVLKASALRSVPLVAVTALAMVGDREKVLAAGFDGYIAKPIEPETFVSEVEAFVPGRAGATPQAASPRAETPSRPPAGTGPTALFLDDLPVNLDLARSMLEPLGWTVLTATSVSEALDVVDAQHVDVVVSDVSTGAETGFDFIVSMKSDARRARVPFVFLSSTDVSGSERDRALALGAVRYLVRPLEPEALIRELEASLVPPDERKR